MKSILQSICFGVTMLTSISCHQKKTTQVEQPLNQKEVTAKDILGNPNYQAICYEGYREKSRELQPSIAQLQEDLKILSAVGIKIVRTYNVQLAHASNLLKAIQELKGTDPNFEMYVMLGAWIDCKNAWTDQAPDHNIESEQNEGEIGRAVALANQYPDIVKILAVGNEAMVKWAASYYVQPSVILKWVNHVQSLKASGQLPKDLWITCSDDFASWGGGDSSYHTEDLEKIIKAVDFISMHTYPYHNTHYNPDFWRVPADESTLSEVEKADAAVVRAVAFAKAQYDSVASYVKSLGVNKPIHIGETGWASASDGFYGSEGSRATDEYKQGKYYQHMRNWTNSSGISCFYFEAFDEQWKDAANPKGSENHFGLFSLTGEAKYPMWKLVDQGVFKNLTRGGTPINKTYNGNEKKLIDEVVAPPAK
ncbi:MAG: glycosyl hydrolase family 17 [Cytophagales bacterium]|jgi:exo-beta-1,3-glucanase (GH17 family)|nr:glycosyl hydrolase family 17 [Cytophagales bacterium]MCA6387615.1 glycosyl hydrolase family 17 [Cytophagales bacterium]MCA6390265.1 glycosyl hydrolase family 17 [Cytophagales bacterium]MCA6399400.1 glycosyl hydrolase family 17 [Cytophagales bacterium]MCA6400678.1 glycosyl hydrolase family 17 [Cytophagales bacterium]